MSEQPFDAEQELGKALAQAADFTKLLTNAAAESMLSKRLYERVPWDKVNQFAGEGWELTPVMSDGLHVMQRQIGPAEQVADALSAIMGGPAGSA